MRLLMDVLCVYVCKKKKGSHTHVKDSVVHVKSSVDYGSIKTTSMHRRLDGATLSQIAFPGESDPNSPLGEIPM